MRHFLIFVLTVLFTTQCYSQKQKNSIQAVADAAVASFTWDIEKVEKGTLMFLDVPYNRDNSDSTEYITLTVAKASNQSRPDFISVIVPNNVIQSNGIFIAFSKTVKKGNDWHIELEKDSTVSVNFENCDDRKNTCTARIINGYVTNDGIKTDIFQKAMAFDHIYILFTYPDGSHKSVGVPLFSFKKQYKTL